MSAPTLRQNTDILGAELARPKMFVFCLQRGLQAGTGAGGRRPWAVGRSEKTPAGVQWGCHCSRRRGARQGFHRPRRGPEEFHWVGWYSVRG